MTLKSRVERIESGIDYAALSREQVARLDIRKLTVPQLPALNVAHLTEAQLESLSVRDLSDAQIDDILASSPPEVRAWLQSLSDEELLAVKEGKAPVPFHLVCDPLAGGITH